LKTRYSRDSTVVITSVGPDKLPEQRAAVETWKSVGGSVISLNHAADRGYTDQVRRFCEVVETDVSAEGVVGKPLIRIDAFLEFFRRSGAGLAIITNADIHLVQPQGLVESLARADCNLLMGQRLDVAALDSPDGEIFKWGFDYFCIDRVAADAIPQSMFAMGAPWWDLWLPMMAVLHGARIVRSRLPVARHVIHDQNWSIASHAWYALHMAEFLGAFATGNLETQRISVEQRAVLADILVPYLMARRHRSLQLAHGVHNTTMQDELEWELYSDFGEVIRLFVERQAPVIDPA
jgi:hypothetical protein